MSATPCGRPKTDGTPCKASSPDGGPCRHHRPETLREKRAQPPRHMPGCTAQRWPGWGRQTDILCLGEAGHVLEVVCIECSVMSVWHVADGHDEHPSAP